MLTPMRSWKMITAENLPLIHDGLNVQAIAVEQRAEFPELWKQCADIIVRTMIVMMIIIKVFVECTSTVTHGSRIP